MENENKLQNMKATMLEELSFELDQYTCQQTSLRYDKYDDKWREETVFENFHEVANNNNNKDKRKNKEE